MTEISLRITEISAKGQRKSYRAGGPNSRALVVNLLSEQGVVGCLTLQFDASGRPFIKLLREQGFDFQVGSFAQLRLLNFIGGENHADPER